MIYLPITTYLDARIAEINNSISGTANDWLKFSLTGEKPENGKLNSYRLMIEDDFEDENISAPAFNVTANVELSFLIPNGDLTKYQDLLDSYIHTLVKHIRNNSAYSYSSAWRLNVMKVGAGDLDNIVDGVLSCTLTMELQIIDGTTIDTNAPSAPTLTSPADGSTSGTVDQSFNWTGTADSWHIIIYLDGVEVISQEGLTVSSFTVPADSSLTDGSAYTWKVRGKNAGGYGDFSSVRTFTVNDTGFDADFTNWLSGLAVAPSSARQTLMNTFIAGLKTDGVWAKLDAIWLIANETAEQGCKNLKANKSNLVPMLSPTFTTDRGYATNGTTQYIRTGEAGKYQNNYVQNNASFGLYVNTNVDENKVDMGSSWTVYSLMYVRTSNTILTSINDGGSTPSKVNTNAVGFYAIDRQASGTYTVYKNGSSLGTQSFSSTGVNDFEFFIGARNNVGTADRFASKRYALAFIGKGMTATEHLNFNSRVSTLLTAIGAN